MSHDNGWANNLSKKWVSCRDNALVKNFQAKDIDDVENMGNIVEDLHNEKLHGEMSYVFEDGVERSVGKFWSDSMNEKEGKRILRKVIMEVGGEEKIKQNKEDYNQGNACGNAMYGHGVRGTNSNLIRCQYEWQGVEYDLVNDDGVFIAKGRVVAWGP